MAGMCSGVKIRDIRKVLAKKELFFMVLMKFLKKRHSKNMNFVVLCNVCGGFRTGMKRVRSGAAAA